VRYTRGVPESNEIEVVVMTPLMIAATAFHETFLTLQQVGFNEDQSLKLVAVLIERSATEA